MRGKMLVSLVCCLLLAVAVVAAAPNEGGLVTREDPAASMIPAIRFALVFEGGPSRECTPKVLEVMSRHGARGTFFPTGKNTALYPELTGWITANGSETGARSVSQQGVAAGAYSVNYEVASTAMLREIAGVPAHYSSALNRNDNYVYTRQLPEVGLAVVYWIVDSRDLSDLTPAGIAERVLADISPGAIIVLHDGDGARQATVDALEIILREADARGYRAVTLSELEGTITRDYYSTRTKTWLNDDAAEVRNVQTRLEELGYDCGGVDGVIGPNTEQGLRRFAQGLKGDGAARPAGSITRPEIRINIPDYSLSLMENGKIVKRYDIAVGTPYEQTPTGYFAVFAKIENPTWYPGSNFTDRTPVPPGADNPLGTRWMEFSPAYGIHGTNKDWDISYPVSGGCIRMHDKEARELYEIVPVGTPVTVVYETLQVAVKSDGLYLRVLPDIYNRLTSTPEKFDELYKPYEAAGYKTLRPVTFPKNPDDVYEQKIAVKQGL